MWRGKKRICPTWDQSDPLWGQIWHLCWRQTMITITLSQYFTLRLREHQVFHMYFLFSMYLPLLLVLFYLLILIDVLFCFSEKWSIYFPWFNRIFVCEKVRSYKANTWSSYWEKYIIMESKPRPPTPRKANHQKFQFGPWTVSTCKSHILESEGPIKRR